MPESQGGGMWIVKTIGLVVLAAVATALLTHWLQQIIWDNPNAGVSGGAAAGVAVAIAMSRRRAQKGDATPTQSP